MAPRDLIFYAITIPNQDDEIFVCPDCKAPSESIPIALSMFRGEEMICPRCLKLISNKEKP